MKIGVCVGTDIERMKIAKEIGYDFVESNCGALVKSTPEVIEEMKNVGIPVYSANCFIGLRVWGPEKDDEAIREYLSKLFERASYLGLKKLVFGSSGARKIREGDTLTVAQAKVKIAEFLKEFVAPLAEKYNIPIAIEPLRPAECNVISTIEDGVELAQAVNSPYIHVLADVAHMYAQNENFDKLNNLSGTIIHAHTSNPAPEGIDKKRIYPTVNDKFNQDDFMLPLVKIGVEACAVEADVIDFAVDAKNAFEVLKKYR